MKSYIVEYKKGSIFKTVRVDNIKTAMDYYQEKAEVYKQVRLYEEEVITTKRLIESQVLS